MDQQERSAPETKEEKGDVTIGRLDGFPKDGLNAV